MAGYHQQPHQLQPQQPIMQQHQPGGQQPTHQMIYQQQQVPGGQIQRTASNTNMTMLPQQAQQQPIYMQQGQPQMQTQQMGGGGGGGVNHPGAMNQALSTPSIPNVLSNQSSPAVAMVNQPTPTSSQLSTGGPLSVGHPGSNPQTPMQNAPGSANPMSQQPMSAAPTPSFPPGTEPNLPSDPVALIKQLIIKDLRQSLIELNKAAAEVIKQKAKSIHGAEAMNPASVINPMSVNPMSANPGSVKSVDNDPKSVDNRSPEKPVKPTSPNEQFLNAYDQFFAVCDQVEKQFMLIQESCRQAKVFDKLVPTDLLNRMAQQAVDVNGYLPYAQGYVDSSDKLLKSLLRCIDNVTAQYKATHDPADTKSADSSLNHDDDGAMETSEHLLGLDD
uniref:Mediator of RNA polymerase II transcription subunit 29 n=1 Tax=Plectus sambesii TaxID=2011161 RepID=A0A914WUQ3_9BILA